LIHFYKSISPPLSGLVLYCPCGKSAVGGWLVWRVGGSGSSEKRIVRIAALHHHTQHQVSYIHSLPAQVRLGWQPR